MSDLPRLSLENLVLEISLSSKLYLVVEGPTDERFFRSWIQDLGESDRVVVTNVEDIEIDDYFVEKLELNLGNRSRVVAVAKEAQEFSNLRCVADRDCGHAVESHTYAPLRWTDFPALESYALDEATLDRVNALSFGDRLPQATELISALAFALRELYAVRQQHPHLKTPKYEDGFTSLPRKLHEFDVVRTVDVSIRTEVPSYPRHTGQDPREYAYGHDIAELLLAVYANALKNQAGLSTRDAVESALRSGIQIIGTFGTEPLFKNLEEWICA